MSYNGSGVFNINSTGNPVVTATTISSTWANALTADLGTGLTTAICKDGQTTTTAAIPFSGGGIQTDTLAPVTASGPISVTAGQLKFPASQNASSNANTLDDYEEGTWTPSLGGTTTYNSQNGSYTKIGRQVRLSGFLDILNIGSGSTTAISGLPFTAAAASGIDYGGVASYFASSVTSFTQLTPYIATGASTISFSCLTAAAGSMTLAPTIFQNSTQIKFNIVYDAAA